jgi:hypothetical protein
MFKNHWSSVLTNIDAYIKEGFESKKELLQLRSLSEQDLLEPLSTYFEYAVMQTSNGEVTNEDYMLNETASKWLAPKLLFGTHTSEYNAEERTDETIESSEPAHHFILEANDPLSPIHCARSYFLSTGALQYDITLEDKLTQSKEDANLIKSYDAKSVK